jgi:outer membrane protein
MDQMLPGARKSSDAKYPGIRELHARVGNHERFFKEFTAQMKRKIFSTMGLALVFSAVSFSQTSTAATAADGTNSTAASNVAMPAKVGIIDIQGAIVSTNEGQRDFDALQKKFEPTQVELKNANDEIEGLKKQLAAVEGKINDDERAKKVQSIESKQKTLQRKLEDAQNEFQQQQNEIAQRIGTKLMDVLGKYATSNNLAMVIDVSTQQSPVLWANPAVNITKPVIDAYNAQSGVAAPPGAKPAGAGAAAVPSAPRPAGTGTTAPRRPTTSTPAPTGTPK